MWSIKLKRDKRSRLEKEIDSVLECMEYYSKDADEYCIMNENLGRLYEAKGKEKLPPGITPDTIVIVLGNLFGILLILKYEELSYISSKALGFIIKGRV